ncbi:hypothetical protein LLEC1_07303, partial [Akanthomyces lecanii]
SAAKYAKIPAVGVALDHSRQDRIVRVHQPREAGRDSGSGAVSARDYSNRGHPKDAKNIVSGYFFISYAEPSPSTSPSSSTSATTTATSTGQPSSSFAPSSGQGLSTGAKTRLAVGAAADSFAIVGAVVSLTRYRSRKNREPQQQMTIGGGSKFYPTPYTSPLPPGA